MFVPSSKYLDSNTMKSLTLIIGNNSLTCTFSPFPSSDHDPLSTPVTSQLSSWPAPWPMGSTDTAAVAEAEPESVVETISFDGEGVKTWQNNRSVLVTEHRSLRPSIPWVPRGSSRQEVMEDRPSWSRHWLTHSITPSMTCTTTSTDWWIQLWT